MKDSYRLLYVKILHTIAWAFFAACVFYVVYSGVFNKISTLTWWTIGFVILEALTLFAFKWTCPLTIVARRYSNSEKHNFDIFPPEWLAKHNKTIFTALFIIGLVMVGLRTLL
jgi:hypothetical protein